MKGFVLALVAALSFGAGYYVGNEQGVALNDRLDAIDTKLADIEKAKPAAQPARAERKAIDPKEALEKISMRKVAVRGPADAPVTIVEYSDFECPFCMRVNETLVKLIEDYDGKVNLVFKHFPLSFHKNAVNAHRASLAAGEQGKFWEMHDLIFATPRALSEEDMKKHAEELGLDMAKFESDFKSDAYGKIIEGDQLEGRKVGVRGTPAFFVNGRYLAGAQPYDAFKKIIDEELEKG